MKGKSLNTVLLASLMGINPLSAPRKAVRRDKPRKVRGPVTDRFLLRRLKLQRNSERCLANGIPRLRHPGRVPVVKKLAFLEPPCGHPVALAGDLYECNLIWATRGIA